MKVWGQRIKNKTGEAKNENQENKSRRKMQTRKKLTQEK